MKKQSDAGNKILEDLDAQRADAQQILLRITAAIQVFEKLLAANPKSPAGRNGP